MQSYCIWILYGRGDYFILCTKASCHHLLSSPKELLSSQIIFIFIEGSPVIKSVKYQNRGTMGVQIPFSFPKILDFKPFQTKVQVLPWQINKTLTKFMYYINFPNKNPNIALNTQKNRFHKKFLGKDFFSCLFNVFSSNIFNASICSLFIVITC